MEYLEFVPINDAHAIVETVIFIQFSHDFSELVVNKLVAMSETLKDIFSESSEVKEVVVSTTNPQEAPTVSPEKITGVELRQLHEDGSVVWVLRAAKNSVSIHCLDYDRWDNVWTIAADILKKVMDNVGENTTETIGLKCIDRFTASKNDSLDFSTLFKIDSPRLPSSAFESGDLWHNYSGWFDNSISGDFPCLNELKISSGTADVKGKMKLVVTIDHGLTIRKHEAKSSLPSFSKIEGSDFNNIILGLHRKNKDIMGDLLTDKMADRVRLKG